MSLRAGDVAVVVWTALWIGMAVLVYHEVRGLRDVSDTLVTTGVAVDRTGRALQTVGDIPFVGGRVRGYADEVRRAGHSAIRSGRSSRDHIDALSVLLAVMVGLVPTVPVLALYFPLRRAAREGRLGARVTA